MQLVDDFVVMMFYFGIRPRREQGGSVFLWFALLGHYVGNKSLA